MKMEYFTFQDSAPQCDPQKTRKEIAGVLLRFISFALAFSLSESALIVSVSLASHIFGPVGSQSISALYFSYAFGTLFASEVVRFSGFSLKPSLVLGQLCLMPFLLFSFYAVNVGSDAYDESVLVDNESAIIETKTMTCIILVLSAVMSGIAAGIAWAAAGSFLTNTALAISWFFDSPRGEPVDGESAHLALEVSQRNRTMHENRKLEQLHQGNIESEPKPRLKDENEREEKLLSRRLWTLVSKYLFRTDFHGLAGNLTGLFNILLLLTILAGHLFSIYALKINDAKHIKNAYRDLCVAASVSAFAMALLVDDPKPTIIKGLYTPQGSLAHNIVAQEGISYNWKIFYSTLMITFNEPRLLYLIGTHLTSGFMEGLVLCYVGGNLVPKPSLIGVLTSMKTISSTIMAPIFSLAGNSKLIGRINVLLVGHVSYLVSCVCIIWMTSQKFENHNSSDGFRGWELFPIYIFAGIGFSTWQGTAAGALISEISASMSRTSSGCNNSQANSLITATFSGSKFLSGIATSVTFFLFADDALSFTWMMAVCIGTGLLGILMLVFGQCIRLWDDENN